MLYGPNVKCHVTRHVLCHVICAMSPYTWQYSIQYVVTSFVLSRIIDRRTIVSVLMKMSSGGHRSSFKMAPTPPKKPLRRSPAKHPLTHCYLVLMWWPRRDCLTALTTARCDVVSPMNRKVHMYMFLCNTWTVILFCVTTRYIFVTHFICSIYVLQHSTLL